MSLIVSAEDTYADPAPDDLVSFSVVCRPKSGIDIDGFRARLRLETLIEVLPADDVRAEVARQLKDRGFEIFDLQSPIVYARGPVRLFQSVFGGELTKRVRRVIKTIPEHTRTRTSIVLREGAAAPSPASIPGALLIVVADRPLPTTPRTPASAPGFSLRLPGDIAQLTSASATHRCRTHLGDRATGGNVAVAMIDTGFADHPYYREHGYRITRLAAPDLISDPDLDPDPAHDDEPHGTLMLACLLACAPDVHAYGVKYGDPAVALAYARNNIPRLKVISLSWAYYLSPNATSADEPIALKTELLLAVAAGVTVIAATGDAQSAQSFPAVMPEVLAVGGVAVGHTDKFSAWKNGLSFSSAIYRGRSVPDLCGITSNMLLPDPGPPYGWRSSAGTSCAAPQVAGVAALLLQKTPALTPQSVRIALMNAATDVTVGQTASGDRAGVGPDQATGAGLVNALDAWNSV